MLEIADRHAHDKRGHGPRVREDTAKMAVPRESPAAGNQPGAVPAGLTGTGVVIASTSHPSWQKTLLRPADFAP